MGINFTNRPGMTNPMTTGGDIIYGGASGVPTRLANGSANQVLTSQGSTNAPIWAAATAVPSYTYVSQSSTLNPAALGSYYLLSGASFTITLPTAASVAGQGFIFQHNGTSLTQVYTFNTTSSQTIGGVASGSYALYTNGEVLQLISDGSNWQIVNHKTSSAITSGTHYISATSAYVFSWTGNQSIVIGDTYTDGTNTFMVSATSNTTSGTFSGNGTPATTGTLTRLTGTGVTPITWTSRTITGAPVIGTTTFNYTRWWREGQFAVINFAINQTSTATVGSGDFIWYFPTGLVADTNLITPNPGTAGSSIFIAPSIQNSVIPITGNFTSGGTNYTSNSMTGSLYGTNTFRISVLLNGGASAGILSSGYAGGVGNQVAWNMTIKVPIAGWQP